MPSRLLPKYGNNPYNNSGLPGGLAPAGHWQIAGIDRARDRLMKKPKPKARKTAIRVRVKPSVKAMAQQLAQKEACSLADWLERLIAAEAKRRGKK
jgi:predicted HicB family RNase H-like nuclease